MPAYAIFTQVTILSQLLPDYAIYPYSTELESVYLPFRYLAYVFVGLLAAALCALLTLTIVRTRGLRDRKEYLIFAGLAFADFVESFATLLAGCYRVVGLTQGWWFVFIGKEATSRKTAEVVKSIWKSSMTKVRKIKTIGRIMIFL